MNQPPANPAVSRIKLLLLASLFFGPLLLAWVLYFAFPGVAPEASSSHGQLLDPARPLPELQLTGPDATPVEGNPFVDRRWTLLFFADRPCDEACRTRLYDTRQVRTALHKRGPRVQRIYVATRPEYLPDAEFVRDQHPDLELYVDAGDGLGPFLAESIEAPGRPDQVFVLDPLANWLMVYRPDDPAKGMLKDLKRLLKLSSIG